ncbi:BRO-N domain-containing protein [Chromobacterium violaceum]|uniref:BRO-N domain-containing protein n=1 Tax=Chromobacterium violaceum TaxID=536 RepID=UPI001CE215B2|nr:BRO family protein [Chromobacterium violaceum]
MANAQAQGTSVPVLFSFENHSVRTVLIAGEAWFVASDIALALGYRETRDMTRTLDPDESAPHNMRVRSDNGVEQDREITIINESGLYSAILRSRKPSAKRFKKWVTSEVLPSIRKTGRYDAAAPAASGARGDIPFVLDHFENEDGHSLTASLDELGVMWVCAGMLGDMLGLENTLALVQAHCRPGGVQMWMDQQVFVDEMNTYLLLARSGSSAADRISDWLAREVLPALRQASFDRLAGLNPEDAQQVDRLSAPQYMKQARELLHGYLESAFGDVVQAPALPQPSAALVDGLLANILQHGRWVVSFDHNMQATMRQIKPSAGVVDVLDRAELEKLIRNVPVALLPDLITTCATRLGTAAARRC